jgi:hypothetical protein
MRRRKKMARLIDADVAIERAHKSDEIVGSSIWETGEVVEFLEDCPIVDAVEVVRCKDCVHRVKGSWAKCTGRRPDDFCSDGVRRLHG